MKAWIVAAVAATGVLVAGTASASADLAQKNCGACHALETKKMGPSFKDIAKKFKGNASAEADIIAKLKSGKGHPAIKTSDADLAGIVKWVLAQ